MRHYLVSFTYNINNTVGFGSCTQHTNRRYFDASNVARAIKDNKEGISNVTIMAFQRIKKKEAEEWNNQL